MEQLFYAHGKLLLNGEYLVLKGAKALALPTRFGQNLMVKSGSGNPVLQWKSYQNQQLWFEASFTLPHFKLETTNHADTAETLQKLLKTALELSDSFQFTNEAIEVETSLEFDRSWGLGSSSTLVSLVAQWIGCDAFELNYRVFGGSGYDIACAQSSGPIVYQIQNQQIQFERVEFSPSFCQHLWFVHLNQKQNSRSEIARFDATKNYSTQIEQVNILTNRMITATSFTEFSKYMDQHEQLISSVIGRETVKKLLFPDFDGSIKSLGAWGGDFVLACTYLPASAVQNYFTQKGFETVIPYNEMILK